MDKTSPSSKRWLIAILVLVVIVVAAALAFGGRHKKAPDKSLGSMSSHVAQVVVI
ncbi:hypothetical protein ACFS5L_24725 [Streptomyces phyllanthi]|uniref:hypothetical protein n=1 Tax=Streptomyces phyllanthi TaxID=1803180 RepID=UPI001D15233D|nr:hypothetical protein [Streptomyces phyllanthi]